MSEIELQLRLDEEGRTAFDASTLVGEKRGSDTGVESIDKKRKRHYGCDSSTAVEEESKKSCHVPQTIDYSCKTVCTALSDNLECWKLGVSDSEDGERRKCERVELLDELLFDCEIADCALMPRTFWLPAKGAKPRCALEQCALEVFHHHVKPGFAYDEDRSGCEWWVQIRPSPPAGRHALLRDDASTPRNHSAAAGTRQTPAVGERGARTSEKQTSKLVELADKGICFHWDKDEELRLLMGGNMYIHPHISTVTYLTSIGAPTMALNYRVDPLTGQYISPPAHHAVDSFLSSPNLGKHLSFDGRYLHAAPYDLMEDGLFDRQLDATNQLHGIADNKQATKVRRRHRRVTFLVNVWLNHKPLNVELFPDGMLDKLTKPLDRHILFHNKNCTDTHSGAISSVDSIDGEPYSLKDYCYGGATVKAASKPDGSDDLVSFQWSLGDGATERVEMQIPLKCVQKQIASGGDVRLKYSCDSEAHRAVRLVKEPITAINSSEEVLR